MTRLCRLTASLQCSPLAWSKLTRSGARPSKLPALMHPCLCLGRSSCFFAGVSEYHQLTRASNNLISSADHVSFFCCCGNIKPEAVFIACRYDSEHFNTAGRSVKTGMFSPKSLCRLPVCNTALDAIGTMVLDRLAISPEPALSHLTQVMQLQQHCHQPATS